MENCSVFEVRASKKITGTTGQRCSVLVPPIQAGQGGEFDFQAQQQLKVLAPKPGCEGTDVRSRFLLLFDLPLHDLAQCVVDAGLIATSVFLKPGKHVCI
jgi:hypothetical protein